MAEVIRRRRIDAEASLAGTGMGTGIVGLSNLLPITPEWHYIRQIILYASPSLTVGGAFVWSIAAFMLRSWYKKRALTKAIAEASKDRDRICGSPLASAKHKENAQLNVEKLEALKFELLNEEIDGIRATLRQVPPPAPPSSGTKA